MRTDPKRTVARGCLAGAAAGLIATFAMGQFHSLCQRAGLLPAQRSKQDATAAAAGNDATAMKEDATVKAAAVSEDATVKAAAALSRAIFHHELTPEQKEIAGPVVDYSFGASMAAIYGGAVEFWPFLRNGWGLPFGVAVWLGAHVITVPALGLSAPVTQSPPEEEAVEFGAHLVYGAIVEALRRVFRRYVLAG